MKETLIGGLEKVFNKLCQLAFGDKLKIFLSDEKTSDLQKKRGDRMWPLIEYWRPEAMALIKNRMIAKNLSTDRIPDEEILIHRYPTRGFLKFAKNRGKYDTAVVVLSAHELRHRVQQKNPSLYLYSKKSLKQWMLNKKRDWERIFKPLIHLCETIHIGKSESEMDALCVSVMAVYAWEKTKDLKAVAQIIKSESKR